MPKRKRSMHQKYTSGDKQGQCKSSCTGCHQRYASGKKKGQCRQDCTGCINHYILPAGIAGIILCKKCSNPAMHGNYGLCLQHRDSSSLQYTAARAAAKTTKTGKNKRAKYNYNSSSSSLFSPPFQCPHCPAKMYSGASGLRSHMKTQHGVTQHIPANLYACKHCGLESRQPQVCISVNDRHNTTCPRYGILRT